MIPIREAQKLLIKAKYKVDMQCPYKELTILDAKYAEVKKFLTDNGYEGNIVVVGKKRPTLTIEETEGIEKYPKGRKIENSVSDSTTTTQRETFYEQLSLF